MSRFFAFATCMMVLALAVAPAFAQEVQTRQIGQMVLEDVPAWDEGLRQRMFQYLAVRGTGLSSVADDGRSILISTRFGETNQLHVVAQPMGARRQITFYDEPVGGGFLPGSGGKRVLLSKDVGGNENYQLHELDLQTGRATTFSDGKSRHQSLVAARSGKLVAFSSNARNGRDFDIYVRPEGSAPRLVWEVSGSFGASAFSPDESKLLVQEYLSERETRWHMLDIASGESQPITPPAPAFYYGGGVWSPDGRYLYFTSDRDGDFRKLYQLDLSYGNWKCLTADLEWDVEDVAVDPASGGLAFVINEDGIFRLYFADGGGGGRRQVELPTGVVSGLTFAASGGVLGFTLNSARAPGDAYTASFPQGALTRWTESEVGGLNAQAFVDAELIRYPTFDQVDGKPRTIPAFVYRPRGASGKRPVVINIHGGPEGQSLPTFNSITQFWANELGMTVIFPNVRGSTGYGRTFHQLDNGVLREDSVKDINALLDWIAQQPDMDAQRVGVYGGSYGGYMVMACLTRYPERFKAGINVVGITSFITFLENTAEYRRDLRRPEYGDERVPEVRKVLEEISPLQRADKIQAALFVVHGQNDPRVPVGEAKQIVAKMREMGRPVWFANALDEGHGFRKKVNRDLASILYAAFWQEHLLK